VGLLKDCLTEATSGTHGKDRAKKHARKAEAWIMDEIKRQLATEAEFNEWALRSARRQWSTCRACPLGDRRERVVFGQGPAEPLAFFVGEAPGEVEDSVGEPFKGPSGALLRAVCRAVGIDLRRDVWITNVVGCRPSRNRKPERDERLACMARLHVQCATLKPRVILLLGGVALRWLQDVDRAPRVSDWRGRVPCKHWPDTGPYGRQNLKLVWVTYHPSYVLHQKAKGGKRVALSKLTSDLRKVGRVLELLNTKTRRGA